MMNAVRSFIFVSEQYKITYSLQIHIWKRKRKGNTTTKRMKIIYIETYN